MLYSIEKGRKSRFSPFFLHISDIFRIFALDLERTYFTARNVTGNAGEHPARDRAVKNTLVLRCESSVSPNPLIFMAQYYFNYQIRIVMRYAVSIDWLALYCLMPEPSGCWQGVTGSGQHLTDPRPWRYKVEDYGTRQFKHLCRVSYPNPAGGYDDFAEVQYEPCSKVLDNRAVIVRFVNRWLYLPDFWDMAAQFLVDNRFRVNNISRIDICADFNQFATIAPMYLIRGFASKQYRHVGRGVGALYFNHGVMKDRDTGRKDYGVQYTGLSFGTHSSDARVYLYNKSFELQTQGDKPYIRDLWRSIGLDVTNVWRLEVSLKSKACTFRDKTFHQDVTIDVPAVHNKEHLAMLYHTFIRKLFAFVRNREGITNITREPRVQLFTGAPFMERGVVRNVSGSTRLERMVLKALWTMSETYRGEDVVGVGDTAKAFAGYIANATDLDEWLKKHAEYWGVDVHK